jgi:hypothetical protein
VALPWVAVLGPGMGVVVVGARSRGVGALPALCWHAWLPLGAAGRRAQGPAGRVAVPGAWVPFEVKGIKKPVWLRVAAAVGSRVRIVPVLPVKAPLLAGRVAVHERGRAGPSCVWLVSGCGGRRGGPLPRPEAAAAVAVGHVGAWWERAGRGYRWPWDAGPVRKPRVAERSTAPVEIPGPLRRCEASR